MIDDFIDEFPDAYQNVDDSVGIDAMSENTQIVFSIGGLDMEVSNGGFDQYFWNSASDYAYLALNSLKK